MNLKFPESTLLKLTAVGALSAFTFSQAFAAGDMSAYDSNKDGAVSKEEFLAKGGQEKDFSAIDANGDGQIDSTEFDKASGASGDGAAPQ